MQEMQDNRESQSKIRNDIRIGSASSSELKLLGLLPSVIRVAEVAVRSSLEVLGFLEVELAHWGKCKHVWENVQTSDLLTDNTRSEIPVVADDLDKLLVGLLASPVGINVDRQRLSNTDGVGELNKGTTSKASSNQ